MPAMSEAHQAVAGHSPATTPTASTSSAKEPSRPPRAAGAKCRAKPASTTAAMTAGSTSRRRSAASARRPAATAIPAAAADNPVMRFPLVSSRAVRQVVRQVVEGATEERERAVVAQHVQGHHLADEDRVVTAVHLAAQAALEVCQRLAQDRHAGEAGMDVDAGGPAGVPPGEGPAHLPWSAARMLTANAPVPRSAGRSLESLWIHTRISGGSSDTDVNEFTVTPTTKEVLPLVTTVTPVVKWPQTLRSSRVSTRAASVMTHPRAGGRR